MIVIGALTGIAIVGTVVSAIALYRSSKRRAPDADSGASLVSARPSPTNVKS
jgi:hypothetical protein